MLLDFLNFQMSSSMSFRNAPPLKRDYFLNWTWLYQYPMFGGLSKFFNFLKLWNLSNLDDPLVQRVLEMDFL